MYAIKLMFTSCRYIVAGVSFFFVTSTRRGIGSLQVMMAGSGRRPSTLIFGGGTFGVLGSVGTDGFRKSPGLSGTSIAGLN